MFHFEDCAVNDKKTIKFQISNKNPYLPLKISFDKNGYFQVIPNTINLQAKETQDLEIIFSPLSLGKFSNNITMVILEAFRVPMNCQGLANQIKKLLNRKAPFLSSYNKDLSLDEK